MALPISDVGLVVVNVVRWLLPAREQQQPRRLRQAGRLYERSKQVGERALCEGPPREPGSGRAVKPSEEVH